MLFYCTQLKAVPPLRSGVYSTFRGLVVGMALVALLLLEYSSGILSRTMQFVLDRQ